MVGRVLTAKSDIVRKSRSAFELVDGAVLSSSEIEELVGLCEKQTGAYEEHVFAGKADYDCTS